jgi:hypothetical protein
MYRRKRYGRELFVQYSVAFGRFYLGVATVKVIVHRLVEVFSLENFQLIFHLVVLRLRFSNKF